MALAQVDEEELLRHRNLAKVFTDIMSDPKARILAEKAIKAKFPDAKTPALDALAAQEEVKSGLEKKFDDYISAQEKEKAERESNEKLGALAKRRDDGFARLRAQGWRDNGIKEVEKMMEEKGILDPLDAAAIYEKSHPPEQPMNPGSTGAWNFMESTIADDGADVDIKKLIETKGQNDMLADSMARKALSEFRQEMGQARR